MNTKIDKNVIIQKIRDLAQSKKVKQITRRDFTKETGISTWNIYKIFDGGWREAVEQAGFVPHYQNIPRRFGNWQNILYTFGKWLENNKIDFPYFNELPSDKKQIILKKETSEQSTTEKLRQWNSIDGNIYGSFLNFRGLQHAPVNEQGVVFLFGMVCAELGFVVEAVRTGYPDCDAKRCIDKKENKWQRIRIEFEFKSSNFKEQGHPVEFCDLIVCWKHDWQDCPLEVLELKSEIKNLKY